MKHLRRALLVLAFIFGSLAPALAQLPPPVPALPDLPRLTSYSISASTCSCAVNFALYGSQGNGDFASWLEVYLNGVRVDATDTTFGWAITSPSGVLSTLPVPITDAILTFTSAQTGVVEIVGALRPARPAQFQENQGVSARNLNVAITTLVAGLREVWDKINDVTGRGLFFAPGNVTGPMPSPTACANGYLRFDATGLNPQCVAVVSPGSLTLGAGVQTALGQPLNSPGGVASYGAVQVVAANKAYVVNSTNGVKCDGATDDAAALNAFFSTIVSDTTLEFPGEAECIFKSPLILPLKNNLVFHGNGVELIYEGSATTGNLVSGGVTGGGGGGGADCSALGWVIEDLRVETTTVMTSSGVGDGGDGLVLNDVCSIYVRGLVVGQGLAGFNNFYNGFHLNGGNTIYITQFSFRGSNAGEVINGNDNGSLGIQLSDAFHNQGNIANGTNYGLWIAGNCGGCQWDNTDILGNHTNIRIDQSLVGIQNRQVVLGPGSASDGTSGSPNIGVDIADAGASGTQFFCKGCWLSTSSNTCLWLRAGVTWEVHLIGARIEDCPTNGVLNDSANTRILVDGGAIAQNGIGIHNTAAAGTATIQIQARPAMFGNGTDEVGMTPAISSGCGGTGSTVNGDDYDFTINWGTSATATCAIAYALAHDAQPLGVQVTPFNASVYANIGTISSSVLSINTNANMTPSNSSLIVHASGAGF